MTAPYDAIIIGGGINGLVAAASLAKAGQRVVLLESDEAIGGQGKSAEFHPGFRADALGQNVGWLPPPVAAELGLGHVTRVLPDPTVAVPAGAGEWLVLHRDVARTAEAIKRFSAADSLKWPAFTALLAKLAGFLEHLYVLPAPDIDASALAFSEVLPLLGVARKFRGLGKRDMVELLRTVPMSVQELLDDWFECDPLKAALGAWGTTDIRQGPRSGATAFVLLHHQVGSGTAIRGRGYWLAGPDALATALAAVAARHGVTVRTGAEVSRILVRDDRVTGVALESGEEIAAGTVVSSADPARTLLHMVDPVWLDPEFLLAVRNIKFRGNTARVLYALNGLPEFPGLTLPAVLAGTLSLSSSLDQIERAADDAKYGRASERPHVELHAPSLRWPGMAPAGKHVVVATARSAPYRLREGAWTEQKRDAFGNRVTAAIATVAPDFPDLVAHCVVGTPVELEATFRLTEGAVTHGEMTLDQILFMRPVAGASRHAMPIAGLYLCGAGTHPGSGVAGGPGWLAARRVLKDRRERRGAPV
jgi:phytoene dehydrogenase-like protein